jgi:tRNA dimethylallyltransferase
MIRVAAIVGATAVGKTELALDVAEATDAEVVSLDSMQAYRGMDIGTAKPTATQMSRVPHHLIDVFDPADAVTVVEFRERARAAIEDIADRGKTPLLVGGSGLYFRAVVDDLRFPPTSPDIRSRLESESDEAGPEALHRRLVQMDPTAAARIEPSNVRRIIRALEAIEITGARFSEFDSSWDRYESIYDLKVAGLTRDRSDLYDRIVRRVDAMLDAGLVVEARTLGADKMSRTAAQALGYRQIFDLPKGTTDEIRTAIVSATKRFARRQESWFRSDPRIEWVAAAAPDAIDQVRRVVR